MKIFASLLTACAVCATSALAQSPSPTATPNTLLGTWRVVRFSDNGVERRFPASFATPKARIGDSTHFRADSAFVKVANDSVALDWYGMQVSTPKTAVHTTDGRCPGTILGFSQQRTLFCTAFLALPSKGRFRPLSSDVYEYRYFDLSKTVVGKVAITWSGDTLVHLKYPNANGSPGSLWLRRK